MSDSTPGRRAAAAALRGLAGGVGQHVSDRVRQELAAAQTEGETATPRRVAAAAVSGLVGGVGQNVADAVRQELGAARADLAESARGAARGAGLLGAAAAAGNTAALFVGVAAWRGLGNRIGFARSAVVVAALSGGAAVVLAAQGRAELARVQERSRAARHRGTPPPGTDSSVVVLGEPAEDGDPGA